MLRMEALTPGRLGLAFTISKSLKVTSSARVFRTPIVPHRVGLLRRREKEPSLHEAYPQFCFWDGGGLQHPGYQLKLSILCDVSTPCV